MIINHLGMYTFVSKSNKRIKKVVAKEYYANIY